MTLAMCTILISKNTIILTCILILIAIIAEAQCKTCCKPPWVGFQRNCYLYVSDETNHQVAETHCQSLSTSARQAHLTSILSKDERKFIKDYVRGIVPSKNKIWTGYNDREVEGSFKWTDGMSSTSYTAWVPGEPNNGGGKEDCGEIYLDSNKWNDVECSRVRSFVCKIPQRLKL